MGRIEGQDMRHMKHLIWPISAWLHTQITTQALPALLYIRCVLVEHLMRMPRLAVGLHVPLVPGSGSSNTDYRRLVTTCGFLFFHNHSASPGKSPGHASASQQGQPHGIIPTR